MERTYLSFNWPNWVTVIIMALIGYLVFVAICQMVPRKAADDANG